MKAQGRDEIENLFRRGLGSYESEPDGHVWEAIQTGIKKKRRKLLWKKILPAVLLMAVLVTGAEMYIHQQQNNNVGLSEPGKNNSYRGSGDRNTAGYTESYGTHADSLTTAGGGRYAEMTQYGLPGKQKGTGKKNGRTNKGGGNASADEGPAMNQHISGVDTVGTQVENDSLKETLADEPKKTDTIRAKTDRAPDKRNKLGNIPRFMASVYGKPAWTALPRMLDSRVLPSFMEPKNLNLKMAAGVGLQYQVSNKLFVSAGFEYFRAEQDMHYTTYKYVQSNKTVKTISTDLKTQHEILSWETLVPDERHTFTLVFESFNYPFRAAYSLFAAEKYSITAVGGIALTHIRRRSYDINDSTYYTGIAAELKQRQRYMSVSLGAGFNYFINSRFTAFINPEYGFLGKDLSQKRRSYGFRNQYFAVSAGIGFKF